VSNFDKEIVLLIFRIKLFLFTSSINW